LEPVESGEKSFRPRNELYFWPLSAAFVLTLLMALARIVVRVIDSRSASAKHGNNGTADTKLSEEPGHV